MFIICSKIFLKRIQYIVLGNHVSILSILSNVVNVNRDLVFMMKKKEGMDMTMAVKKTMDMTGQLFGEDVVC